MSEQEPVSNEEAVQSDAGSEPTKEEFVHKKVAEDYKNDMHKFKSRAKEAQAKANELELKLKSIEEEKLKQNEEYQQLWEKAKAETEALAHANATLIEKQETSKKLQALKNELGNIKDAYLIHANVKEIELNEDGTLSSESVHAVANQFRQEYPELVPKNSGGNITGQAPPSDRTVSNSPATLAEMSTDQKIAALAQLKNRS